MKKILFILVATLFLAACGGEEAKPEPDYTTEQLETALNDGEDPTGKIVTVEVEKLVPDSAFGYNIQTGEHLNFVSNSNPNVETGEEITVEVTEVQSVMSSYIINYEEK